MTLSSTRPILKFVESILRVIANFFGKGSHQAWWLTILSFTPIMGSLITEPGAMTIGALLLGSRFYQYHPSNNFKYATLGLLFVNISVGGTLTHFAAPPVLMVARAWDWGTAHMFMNFGWKAITGILISNIFYFFLFRKEFSKLHPPAEKPVMVKGALPADAPVPLWITIIHLLMLVWIVFNNHHPVIFVGSFLIFLGFHQATAPYQHPVSLRPSVLVGFFLAGLVIHGGLQGWWIQPILSHLGATSLMGIATILTAFNDNAVITYLTTLVPGFTDPLKYAVVAGAVTGGGLTVLANAPNPAGQVLLQKYFGDGISPFSLFFAASLPTLIMLMCFALLP
jgi:hypothetical protein